MFVQDEKLTRAASFVESLILNDESFLLGHHLGHDLVLHRIGLLLSQTLRHLLVSETDTQRLSLERQRIPKKLRIQPWQPPFRRQRSRRLLRRRRSSFSFVRPGARRIFVNFGEISRFKTLKQTTPWQNLTLDYRP